MQLDQALFHWLQMLIVWETRPDDRSAEETVLFFEEMLKEDHRVTRLEKKIAQNQYKILFQHAEKEHTQTFSRQAAEQLLQDICDEPKYHLSFGDSGSTGA
jgi:hypothetical protein